VNESDVDRLLNSIIFEHGKKTSFVRSLRGALFENEPEWRVNFNIIIQRLQDKLENTFDRILRNYIRPKHKDEFLFDDEIKKCSCAGMTPEEVRNFVIFNLEFARKKKLIYKLFKIDTNTRKCIDKLNELRNAVAHRYEEDAKRFKFDGKNMLHHYPTMIKFLTDAIKAICNVQEIDTLLMDTIDKVEKELE